MCTYMYLILVYLNESISEYTCVYIWRERERERERERGGGGELCVHIFGTQAKSTSDGSGSWGTVAARILQMLLPVRACGDLA